MDGWTDGWLEGQMVRALDGQRVGWQSQLCKSLELSQFVSTHFWHVDKEVASLK